MTKHKTKPSQELAATRVNEKVQTAKGDGGFFGAENLRSLLFLVLAIVIIRSSVVSPYHVPTPSMEPTIKVGDHLLANKLAYGLKFSVPYTQIDFHFMSWGTPARGDIIVFRYPENPNIDYVKRVVAIAGDKISVIDDILHINGEPIDRKNHNDDREILVDIHDNASNKDLFVENLDGKEFFVMQYKAANRHFNKTNWPGGGRQYEVPADSVFVMGDNRDNSQDSRVWNEVPVSYIRGKATFVLWSFYTPNNENWPTLRYNRFGHRF